MLAGGLLPAPFMAVMEMVKSLFSSSPVRVYSLKVPFTVLVLLPITLQPLTVNEYDIWYESTTSPGDWLHVKVMKVDMEEVFRISGEEGESEHHKITISCMQTVL